MRFSETHRLPELRLLDQDRSVAVEHADTFDDVDDAGVAFDAALERELHLAVGAVSLTHLHVPEPRRVVDELDRAPDAARDQPRAPIPPEHALHLAHEGAILEPLVGFEQPFLRGVLGAPLDADSRRRKKSTRSSFSPARRRPLTATSSGTNMLSCSATSSPLRKTRHTVSSPSKRRTLWGRSVSGLPGEGGPVTEVLFVHPLATELLHALERVPDDTVLDQVEVHVPRHARGQPLGVGEADAIPGVSHEVLSKAPVVVKGRLSQHEGRPFLTERGRTAS